jgi:hypothetical protein
MNRVNPGTSIPIYQQGVHLRATGTLLPHYFPCGTYCRRKSPIAMLAGLPTFENETLQVVHDIMRFLAAPRVRMLFCI